MHFGKSDVTEEYEDPCGQGNVNPHSGAAGSLMKVG